jgi:hypothetical protein
MTKKRFTINSYSSYDTTTIKDNSSTRVLSVIDCVDELNYLNKVENELYKENEQLKSENNRLINETAKVVAEHQRKVFELIDEKINEYIYKEKLYKHKGKDREASVFNLYCFCLNNLKKELSE